MDKNILKIYPDFSVLIQNYASYSSLNNKDLLYYKEDIINKLINLYGKINLHKNYTDDFKHLFNIFTEVEDDLFLKLLSIKNHKKIFVN